jgi:hypothetical protein
LAVMRYCPVIKALCEHARFVEVPQTREYRHMCAWGLGPTRARVVRECPRRADNAPLPAGRPPLNLRGGEGEL